MDFVKKVVDEHKTSADYRVAADAELYYAKRNPTISRAQKYVYDEQGIQVPDVWSSNYKLTHGFFRRFVLQQVQYILSNGVTFQKKDTKNSTIIDIGINAQTYVIKKPTKYWNSLYSWIMKGNMRLT